MIKQSTKKSILTKMLGIDNKPEEQLSPSSLRCELESLQVDTCKLYDRVFKTEHGPAWVAGFERLSTDDQISTLDGLLAELSDKFDMPLER